MKDTLISHYVVDGDTIIIHTPFCDDVVDTCRRWAGKFADGGWRVPITRLAEVQSRLGTDLDDIVEVEVQKTDWEGRAQIHVGWYVLAGRRGRDRRADVYATLVAGEIPSSGGSVKNPSVASSSDARFRLWVARDFATTRNLEIVNDPREAPAGCSHTGADTPTSDQPRSITVSVNPDVVSYLIERMRVASRGKQMLRIQDVQTHACVMEFEHYEESAARVWLAEHQRLRPESQYELVLHRIFSNEERLLHDAGNFLASLLPSDINDADEDAHDAQTTS